MIVSKACVFCVHSDNVTHLVSVATANVFVTFVEIMVQLVLYLVQSGLAFTHLSSHLMNCPYCN